MIEQTFASVSRQAIYKNISHSNVTNVTKTLISYQLKRHYLKKIMTSLTYHMLVVNVEED